MRKKTPSVYRFFGMAVRDARDDSGMTQQAVADKLGCTRAHIANIEAGNTCVLLHTILELEVILCANLVNKAPAPRKTAVQLSRLRNEIKHTKVALDRIRRVIEALPRG